MIKWGNVLSNKLDESYENVTYAEFINRILNIRGRFNCEGYCERHHIVPRCMGGGDEEDNLIDLYAREHFEAHRILALENPHNKSLTYAWWCMSVLTNKDTMMRETLSAKEYEEVKQIYSKLQSEREISEDTRKKISDTMKGRKYDLSRRQHISESLKDNPNVGIVGLITIYKNQEIKRVQQVELPKYIDDGWILGRPPMSQETKDKISRGNKGKDNFFKGKKRGCQTKEHTYKCTAYKKGQIHINNGIVSKMINKEDFEKYEQQGFVRGRLKWK